MAHPLQLSRAQLLAFRRRVSALDERLPKGIRSLRSAAWAGLQDSMPRAALLSLHARVEGVVAQSWEHPSLVQLWGPRFSAYVVAAKDVPVFTLGRLPTDPGRHARALDTAARLHAFLRGRRLPFGEVGRGLGVPHNSLRYAAPTGTVLLRWAGATQPVIWTVPEPALEPARARLELARRYLRIFGPGTAASFASWAGVKPGEARSTWQALEAELTAVRTPLGDACILAEDEPLLRAAPGPAAPARLLPSGDTYYLCWGTERALLVPDAKQRAALWTTRVWPGALLVAGELVGTWRRAAHDLTLHSWRRLSAAERAAVEAEALALPLPGLERPMSVRWS